MEKNVGEIRLVSERIGPAEHRQMRFLDQRGEWRGIQEDPDAIDEPFRILAERDEGDAARIVHVFVEDA